MSDDQTTSVGSPPEQAPPPDVIPGSEGTGIGGPQTSVGESPPASVEPTTPSPTDWDSPANPYKYTAEQLYQAQLQQQEQVFRQGLMQQAETLKQQGYSDEQVQNWAILQYQHRQVTAQREELNNRARPVVAQELVSRIAQTYGVTIQPQELLTSSSGQSISTPEAMIARADALIQERRKTAFQDRQKSGADKVGQAGGVQPIDQARLQKMSPAQLIREGLRRQK